MLCLLSYSTLMNVLLVQLLCVHFLLYKEYYMVTTVAFKKFCIDAEHWDVKWVYPKPSMAVSLPYIVNTDQGHEEDVPVLVDEIASADTIMVLRPCFSQTEANFQGERILNSLLRLNILFQGTTYTVSERRRC